MTRKKQKQTKNRNFMTVFIFRTLQNVFLPGRGFTFWSVVVRRGSLGAQGPHFYLDLHSNYLPFSVFLRCEIFAAINSTNQVWSNIKINSVSTSIGFDGHVNKAAEQVFILFFFIIIIISLLSSRNLESLYRLSINYLLSFFRNSLGSNQLLNFTVFLFFCCFFFSLDQTSEPL